MESSGNTGRPYGEMIDLNYLKEILVIYKKEDT